MPYHPLYDGLWHHEDLEGAPFEEKAFFIFLWSNPRMRPSGIYRVTDEQLAADAELPVKRVQAYLGDLSRRLRIVRDGAWVFVRGYFARQPKQERLLLGVQSDINSCSSVPILKSFGEKYPVFDKWSTDRLQKVSNPHNDMRSPDTDAVTEAVAVAVTDPKKLSCAANDAARHVLDWLIQKTGRGFRAKEPNLALIRARLADGFTDWQLKAIVSEKVEQWRNDPKMATYLRPKTLFNKTNCEQYFAELKLPPRPPDA
jgi:uncharacterized phage protein (TIGR02220 family)